MRIESVLKYIPPDRRGSIAQGVPLASAAHGSVLFADISGFTPLTETLSRTLGARLGAEELTRHLNHVYDALVHQVDQYGGSIISFSGDAITCWFDGDSGARAATTCAMALQRAMAAFDRLALPNGDSISLSLKVSVASGAVRRFLVGDPDMLVLDVLAGKTIARMADGEHIAQKGEVIVDEPTAALLSDSCTIGEWRDEPRTGQRFAAISALTEGAAPTPWGSRDPEFFTFEQVRSWMIQALIDREDESMTELRPAMAVFLRFDGIDYDNDSDAGVKLDGYIRWVQGVVARYDGTLMQLTVGDKGSFVYIAFGAPIAHENDARRGVSAALELRDLPADLAYIHSLQIGISQGMMRTGAYGGETRRTYGVLGDNVNLAARLMQHAPLGGILVSGAVHKALSDVFRFDVLPPLRVKGKQEPVAVARLIGKAEEKASMYVRPLVGRSAELSRLLARLAPIAEGQPTGCIWVYGEPGVGKSHLVHEAMQKMLLGDRTGSLSFVTDQLVQHSLHPFVSVLEWRFRQDGDSSDAQRKERFQNEIDTLAAGLTERGDRLALTAATQLNEMQSFLGALLGLRWNGSPYENSAPKLRFNQSLLAMTVWIQAESLCKPLIVHIQDAQWLDADSQTVIESWIVSAAEFPIALVIDSRHFLDQDRMRYGKAEQALVHPFPVAELEASGIAELAVLVLNGAISEPVCDYLIRKANGNPFFTEQLALDLSERGLITWSDTGLWMLDTSAAEDIPITLNGVLIARLDRLLMQVRTVVQIASILGQEFDVSVLAQMIRDDPEVRLKVKQAEVEMIWFASSELDYLFRHALLRDAAYSMQLQARQRELHALAGWAIEQVHQGNLAPKSPDLAFHYEKAAVYERAIIYLIKSAQHMTGLYANREAILYYRRALDMVEKTLLPPFEIAPIHEGLGDIYDVSGEYPLSVTHYDLALLCLDSEQASWRATLQRKRGQVLQKWGRYDEATTAFEAGLVELQADLDPDEASQIYSGLSMINYRQDKVEDATELATLALIMAQMQEDKGNLAYAHQILGILHWKRGDYEQALEANTHSLALWQASDSQLGQAAVQNNLGLLLRSMGEVPKAIGHFERCLTLFERVGNLHGLACAYDNLGQIYNEQGDESMAFDCLEKAVGILAKIGLTETQVFTSMWQSGTW